MRAWLRRWWLVVWAVYWSGMAWTISVNDELVWIFSAFNLVVIAVLLVLTIRDAIRMHREHKVLMAEHKKKMAEFDRQMAAFQTHLLNMAAAVSSPYWTKEKAEREN